MPQQAANDGGGHVAAADECDVDRSTMAQSCLNYRPATAAAVTGGQKMAVPTRTMVGAFATAASRSLLMPIDSVSTPKPRATARTACAPDAGGVPFARPHGSGARGGQGHDAAQGQSRQGEPQPAPGPVFLGAQPLLLSSPLVFTCTHTCKGGRWPGAVRSGAGQFSVDHVWTQSNASATGWVLLFCSGPIRVPFQFGANIRQGGNLVERLLHVVFFQTVLPGVEWLHAHSPQEMSF